MPYFYHFLNRLYIVKEMPILTFVAYLNKRKRFLIRVCFIFLHKNIVPYEKPKATTKKNVGVSLMLLLFLFISNCASGDKIFSTDVWNITYDDQQGGIALTYKSKNICNGMYASYQWEGRRSRQVTMPAIKSVRAKFPILRERTYI